MKVYMLVDDQNIVRCVASEEANLHQNKLSSMVKHHVERGGTVGDEYKDGKWTPHPENYPQPSADELTERRIQKRRLETDRAAALAANDAEAVAYLDKQIGGLDGLSGH